MHLNYDDDEGNDNENNALVDEADPPQGYDDGEYENEECPS